MDIVKKGYLNCCLRGILKSKQWQKRWCVLHSSGGDGPTKLDFYETETDNLDKKPKQTIFVKDILKIERVSDKEQPHVFEITTKETTCSFSADCEVDGNNWVKVIDSLTEVAHNVTGRRRSSAGSEKSDDVLFDENELYEAAERPETFEVNIQENDSAEKCNLQGEYNLNINSMNISIVNKNLETLYVFPFRYIRRYGKSKSNFTFEAGRKCTSGEGYFVLLTTEGAAIVKSMVQKIKEMKVRQQTLTKSEQQEQKTLSSKTSPGMSPKPAVKGVKLYENFPRSDSVPQPGKAVSRSHFFVQRSASHDTPVKFHDELAKKIQGKPPPTTPKPQIQKKPNFKSPDSEAVYATPDDPTDEEGYGKLYSSTQTKNPQEAAWIKHGLSTKQIRHEEHYGNIRKNKTRSTGVKKNAVDQLCDDVHYRASLQDADSYDHLSFQAKSKVAVGAPSSDHVYGHVDRATDDVVYSCGNEYEDAEPRVKPVPSVDDDEYAYIGHANFQK